MKNFSPKANPAKQINGHRSTGNNGKGNGNGAWRPPQYVLDLLKARDGDVIKLDIGGGRSPQQGFLNMDMQKLPTVDIVHDWDSFPWPFPDKSVTIITAMHVVEHVDPARFGFIKWMNEAWRILKYEGQLVIVVPYAGSEGYWADPTHCNPCTKHTWRYFDPTDPQKLFDIYTPKPWRIKLCNFNVDGIMDVILVKRRWEATENA